MELVSKYCLEIRQMLFMFQNTHCRISVLTNFHHLEDLDLWGGAFYTDGICELLEQIGGFPIEIDTQINTSIHIA